MPYQATDAIYSDKSPLSDEFDGRLLKEGDPDAAFVVVGKGGIISDADAEKLGLKGGGFARSVELDDVKREADEKNQATHQGFTSIVTSPVTAEPASIAPKARK